MKLGRLGLVQTARPAPTIPLPLSRLAKLGSPGIAKCSAVTERELAKSSCGVGPSWSRACGINSAASTAAVKSAGIVKYSVTSESESELADDLEFVRVA